MFGFTKKNSSIPINPQNQNQPAAFDFDTAPIHTMRDDLENPAGQSASVSNSPQSMPVQKQQSHSPFLESTDKKTLNNPLVEKANLQASQQITATSDWNKTTKSENTQTQSNPKTTNSFSPSSFKATPSMTKDHAFFHYNWRLIFFSGISLILIIVLGWLGFNYTKTKTLDTPPIAAEPITTEPKALTQPVKLPGETPSAKPVLSFSLENPNYLHIEDKGLLANKIKATVEQVSTEGYAMPVEFVLTEAGNKPMPLKDFSLAMNLPFSTGVLTLLGDNFSLFVYNDVAGPRAGLAIESKNDIELAKNMLLEEKTLATKISPLFFTSEYKTEKDFAGSEYNTVKVRYQNIISPDMLSVDYAVHKNKLLIGTTKLTLRSVIDKLNATAPAPSTSPVTTPPTQNNSVTTPTSGVTSTPMSPVPTNPVTTPSP